MNARAHAEEERRTLWGKLWHVVHGPVEVTAREERLAMWARLEALEAAARELGAWEAVEARRAREGDER